MGVLETLAVSDASKRQALPPHLASRAKLVDAINNQIAGAEASINNKPFTKKVERWVSDPVTGERSRETGDGKFRKWWWTNETGVVCLEVKYANKAIEIRQGKRVIEVGTMDKLIPVLEQLRTATQSGELDKSLTAALAQRRKEMTRAKQKKTA